MNTWYGKTTNSGSAHEQGLVIDENTGANIAVCYDPQHVHLIASAPELLAACKQAFHVFENDTPRKCEAMGLFEVAIAKAEGAQ